MESPKINKPSFESQIGIIDRALQKRRKNWHLNAVKDLSFEDVAQKIRIHIWEKWDQWDPEIGPLDRWVNKIITHQMYNILRDNYYNFAKPCLRCPYAKENEVTGDNTGCMIWGAQCDKCGPFAKWLKSKQDAFNVKLALPLENHTHHVADSVIHESDIDYDELREKLHALLLPKLTKTQRKVYTLLFIDEKSEDEVADIMGYKPSKTGKNKHRYKQISNYIKIFKDKTKIILERHDIFYE